VRPERQTHDSGASRKLRRITRLSGIENDASVVPHVTYPKSFATSTSRKIQVSGEFMEGWAFYGEELCVQSGLYGNDLDGRYYTAQWERVHGARTIVDRELASGAWSVDRAVQFFAHQTGFSVEQAKAAIAGIAWGPGYMIAYTAGRAEIEALLAEYRAKGGAGASLRGFHDRLLCYGSTPLSVVGPALLAKLS